MRIGLMCVNLVVVSLIGLTGCSKADMNAMVGQGDVVTTSKQSFKPTQPATIKIYQNQLPKHSQVIGRVTAQNYNLVGMTNSQESIFLELKKRAASIGATGIAHISTGLAQTTADAIVTK
ncbi:hypothetical protein [Legionella fairfieldensis]|uniref:hypothetical protein n=1 Tax=Legionella fairfieldensis TaxID=45064 RepID=UPI00048EBB1B|nr:hypothetical protein [Legionella fairfieldensis]